MELGKNIHHYCTGDEGRATCPSCYNNTDTVVMGKLHSKNNHSQEVFKCNSCNIIFSDPSSQGAIMNLIQEAENLGAEEVEFTSYRESSGSGPVNLDGHVSVDNYQLESKVQQMSDEIISMRCSIDSLVSAIYTLNEQNKEMMEKLVKDPLVGMRRAINNFNLE